MIITQKGKLHLNNLKYHFKIIPFNFMHHMCFVCPYFLSYLHKELAHWKNSKQNDSPLRKITLISVFSKVPMADFHLMLGLP